MAVSPDLLLNIKAPTAVAKAASATPQAARQPSRDEPSSFANVYAKERQPKPVERQDSAAKPVRDKPAGDKPSQETAEAGGSEKPTVAEAGNELPADAEMADGAPQDGETELDPLLLFGMGGQVPVSDESLATQPPTGSEFLAGLGLAQAGVESAEAEAEPAMVGTRSLDIQSAAQKSPFANAVMPNEASEQTQETLSASLLVGEELTEESDELSLEESFSDLLDKLDAPKESRTSATDMAANRLNPLTQAIAQQTQAQQAQRLTMVPGQPVQMQQSGWSEAVVDKVMWLSSQNLKSAEIQLDPAELGRMEIRIDMNKDQTQTQVTFLSPHAGVRDALEGQMQRLRDMFAQQGMTMDVNVSDQSKGWQGDGSESRSRSVAGVSATGDEEIVGGTLEVSTSRSGGDRGLVDYYA
ncbi:MULTISPECIES: flagellar hook-length control protein FliK [Pseudomonadaceae]|uniref:flagellar hook-length control protein FliK n=1 Tax=Pseudomonadaceae TaxID=135621 RepID=UPI00103BC318|nr:MULTISPECIES: flagellar hook-length control protein FliK [Pseudomonadaceae]MBA1277365.1 flagellar hook-length control protein FliK [Stutzerimonas stutzeri]TCD21158.1 flagellar hook-length control protein FliK [Pseudomonas sp. IC_126]